MLPAIDAHRAWAAPRAERSLHSSSSLGTAVCPTLSHLHRVAVLKESRSTPVITRSTHENAVLPQHRKRNIRRRQEEAVAKLLAASSKQQALKRQMEALKSGQPVPFVHRLAYAGNCFASGAAAARGHVRDSCEFLVTLRDKHGERVSSGSLNQIRVSAQGPARLTTEVESRGDGLYVVRYYALVPGTYHVTVMCNGMAISNSPLTVEIADIKVGPSADSNPEACAEKSYAKGEHAHHGLLKSSCRFSVVVCDAEGERIFSGGDRIRLATAHGQGTLKTSTEDNGRARCPLPPHPSAAATSTHPTLPTAASYPIPPPPTFSPIGRRASPFRPTRSCPPSHRTVPPPTLRPPSPPVSSHTAAHAAASRDGTHAVTYYSSVSGTYALSISCNGFPIAGSPFSICVSPSPAQLASEARLRQACMCMSAHVCACPCVCA